MIPVIMTRSTQQLLLRLPPDLMRRLEEAEKRYGRLSKQQITIEVLDSYLSFWEELEEQRLAMIEVQRAARLEQPLRKRA